jgi:hypothetical protein
MVCLVLGLSVGSPLFATGEPKASDDRGTPVTEAEARARAKLMHGICAATLDSMHHHFFQRGRPVLPARAMEDVFAEVEKQSKIKAKWISVNTKAMSIDHEPRTSFERKAAKAIAEGKGEFELVEDGVYCRAGAIPLGAGCVTCHTGLLATTPQTERFAGLVISVPIDKK